MGILNILYPARCPVCHGVTQGQELVCETCRKKIHYIKEPRCKKCGKEIRKEEQEYCKDCQRFVHSFDNGVSVFPYDEIMRRSISMFKYQNHREYADFYAAEMYQRCGHFLCRWNPEVILPVPIHRQKKRRRGFNQSELVAKKLGKLSGIPVDTKYLVRKKNTTPQKELTRQQRKQNLKSAFTISEEKKRYKSVLVIDDIYTTGATIDAISEILRENQTKKVFFLTICVGRND